MYIYRSVVVRLAFGLALVAAAPAQQHIILFPSPGGNVGNVLDEASLAPQGMLPMPSGTYAVEPSFDGSKYYVGVSRPTDSILVVDSTTLEPISAISLGTGSSQIKLTPNGKYLIAVADTVRIIDTATDQEMGPGISVGGSPTEMVLDPNSRFAYVLSGGGNLVNIVDIEGRTVVDFIPATEASAIALTPDGSRLAILSDDVLRHYRVDDRTLIGEIPANLLLRNADLIPVPNTRRMVARTRGAPPDNTSQLFDLDTNEVHNIGIVGGTEFLQIVVKDDTTAYGILSATRELALIDLAADPKPTVTELPTGLGLTDLALTPNGKRLYVTSRADAALAEIDTATNTVGAPIALPTAPSRVTILFGPSGLPAATVEIVGGNNQFYPPDATLPSPFSVRVLDVDGNPLRGVPVLFEDVSEFGLLFDPPQPSITTIDGIASVAVTTPPEPPAMAAREEGGEPKDGFLNQPEEFLDPIVVAARTGSLQPVPFTLTVIRGQGLLTISGDNQVARENEQFPLPFVLLATDDQGRPLPPLTEIFVSTFFASCEHTRLYVDSSGFAQVKCTGFPFGPFSSSLFEQGNLVATIPSLGEILGPALTRARFSFAVARSGTQVGIQKVSGDNQIGVTGDTLPLPLGFKLSSNFGSPLSGVGIEVAQVSGPPVIFSPRRLATYPNLIEGIAVKLGTAPGVATIRVTASVPGLPSLFYTVTATGGVPIRLQTSGDGQSGTIFSTLPTPLSVQVINESETVVPFPDVMWSVIEGDASINVVAGATASSATVTFGANPGPVRIRASIGNLQTLFNLTSNLPQPTSISTFSGQNQILTTGVLSEPLVVRVRNVDSTSSVGAPVTFSGPPSVRLHPVGGGNPARQVIVAADTEGLAAVRVELLSTSALGVEGASPEQLSSTVSIIASVGSGQLSTSFLLNIVGRIPVFEAAGVVNAATFEGGIVPGSLASLFGTGLMEGVLGTEFANGNTSFGGTTIRIGGTAAPLLTLTSGASEQINLQVPFDLSPGRNTTIEIENNGSRTTVGGVPVFTAQPGIFEIPLSGGGTIAAVIQAQTGALITPDSPAGREDILSVFATGLGPVSPAVQTGQLGPLPPPVTTLPEIVGVDNAGAEVFFSGYAPGFLGLYQLNFKIPLDARCGLRPISIRMGDTESPSSTIAIRCP